MKIKYYLALAVLTAVFAVSCSQSSKQQTSDSESEMIDSTVQDTVHTSQNSLDWEGTYEGLLPCADCEGIRTVIVLNSNLSYTKEETYLGKKDSNFSSKGTFEWKSGGRTIVLKSTDGDISQFRVNEGNILMLNTDGTEVTGDLASHYRLMKK